MASTKRDKTDRKALVEQLQREQKAHERRRMLLSTGVLALVLVLLVVGVILGTRHSHKPAVLGKQILPSSITTGTVTVQPPPTVVTNTSGISGVVAYDTDGWPGDGSAHPGALGHDHVTGPVKYAVTPPVGGPHNGVWMNAGVYTSPIPNERAVHNLEHGAVWITYRPNLPASEVTALEAFVTKQSMISESGGQANRYMDLSPWVDNTLPSPIVLSAWGYQLKVTSPTDPRMQKFVDLFRHNQKYTPEFGAAVDGIPVETGGQPALDGSKFANPSGAVSGQ